MQILKLGALYGLLAANFIGVHFLIMGFSPAYAQSLDAERLPSRSLIEQMGRVLGIAPVQGARPIPRIALEIIKAFEGWFPNAYDDPVGYCTIGYGHLIALVNCKDANLGEFDKPLSIQSGSVLLEKDTLAARQSVNRLVNVALNDAQFGALSSFVFNIGESNFASSTMLQLINIGRHDLAANQFARWTMARGKIFKGLTERRQCKSALYQGYFANIDAAKFSRDMCKALGVSPDATSLIDVEVGEQK